MAVVNVLGMEMTEEEYTTLKRLLLFMGLIGAIGALLSLYLAHTEGRV